MAPCCYAERELRRLAVLFLLLASCDDRPDQWDAYITYSEDPERSEVIEGFRTYELCRSASLARIEAEGASETGYFECGYKCGFKPGYPQKICKESRD
jgi:hypothetical protein